MRSFGGSVRVFGGGRVLRQDVGLCFCGGALRIIAETLHIFAGALHNLAGALHISAGALLFDRVLTFDGAILTAVRSAGMVQASPDRTSITHAFWGNDFRCFLRCSHCLT